MKIRRTVQDRFQIIERYNKWTSGNKSDLTELESLARDLLRFYPPAVPIVFLAKEELSERPITKESLAAHRAIVEQFGRYFENEMPILYERPIFPLLTPSRSIFDTFSQNNFEAWLCLQKMDNTRFKSEEARNEVISRDGYPCNAVGCVLFYQDDRLSNEQKEKSTWVASFAWIHPFYRRLGLFEKLENSFQKYGDYWIEGPISSAMAKYCEKRRICTSRVLACGRYRMDNIKDIDISISHVISAKVIADQLNMQLKDIPQEKLCEILTGTYSYQLRTAFGEAKNIKVRVDANEYPAHGQIEINIHPEELASRFFEFCERVIKSSFVDVTERYPDSWLEEDGTSDN